MAKIFVTKLGYLQTAEFQVAKKPGEWSDSRPVFKTALEAVSSTLKEIKSNTEIHVIEISDFDCYGKPVLKLSSISTETLKINL